jgi:hypothetical protein
MSDLQFGTETLQQQAIPAPQNTTHASARRKRIQLSFISIMMASDMPVGKSTRCWITQEE